MTPIIDLTGRIFGKLKVLELAGSKQGHAQWLVECSCAKRTRKIISGHNLRRGDTRSCHKCPNDIETRPDGVIVIKLVRRDGSTHKCFIDAEDYPLVKDYKWTTSKAEKGYYARTIFWNGDRYVSTDMHKIVRSDVPGKVDHKNKNGLDNRRTNLRPASTPQNAFNRSGRKPASGYWGVYPKRGKFHASIMAEGVSHFVGSFETARAAAIARDRAAKKYHGAFATLNFPPAPAVGFILEKRSDSLFRRLKHRGE